MRAGKANVYEELRRTTPGRLADQRLVRCPRRKQAASVLGLQVILGLRMVTRGGTATAPNA